MKKQLNDEDGTTLYSADGILKLYGVKDLEILLLETSSFCGCTSNVKIDFDHHKGLFGTLAMIKTIAYIYYFGSVDTFTKIKILFTHAAGTIIYLWSLKYVKDGPIYELWLEGFLNIEPKFEDRFEMLPKMINFY
ncbi:uncharacterized protein BX663DRAFT_538130 [Cokeromyces recurvatus]|uniref:uncharacterized protein n=1 Tax=Cokeromyces recurvatus TaxID=90255 RepID=UPI00221F1945|nr:uncharacterized protein BX663DRAFT_538130 [Cokeromyces recurvatus]KAI7899275.1 hypothetical protein BX663DRAFT_538130 [Cokeromyces recurvatus]